MITVKDDDVYLPYFNGAVKLSAEHAKQVKGLMERNEPINGLFTNESNTVGLLVENGRIKRVLDISAIEKAEFLKKTFGNLIDELSITNLKIWNFENVKRQPEATDEEIANATKQTNHLNWYRNKLIQSIDELCAEMGLVQDCYKQGDTKSYAE